MAANAMAVRHSLLSSIAARVVSRWPTTRPWFIWVKFRVFGERINRNQWSTDHEGRGTYLRLLDLSWEETRKEYVNYFKLLEPVVKHARGRVLEIGCGIGNMTRWLAQSDQVESVLAVDGFQEGLERVTAAKLPKVETLCALADKLQLPAGRKFDTVIMTEILEHLYADEERALLVAILPHVAPGARYIVSTPIGWMHDAYHVRGFSKRQFRKHLGRDYGEIELVDFASGYSQLAVGKFHEAPATAPAQ
jgi:2-polyprenyl-3-methyl-5-hydroxy-6-metoxy-1,4-benzoquinol methylase